MLSTLCGQIDGWLNHDNNTYGRFWLFRGLKWVQSVAKSAQNFGQTKKAWEKSVLNGFWGFWTRWVRIWSQFSVKKIAWSANGIVDFGCPQLYFPINSEVSLFSVISHRLTFSLCTMEPRTGCSSTLLQSLYVRHIDIPGSHTAWNSREACSFLIK